MLGAALKSVLHWKIILKFSDKNISPLYNSGYIRGSETSDESVLVVRDIFRYQ